MPDAHPAQIRPLRLKQLQLLQGHGAHPGVGEQRQPGVPLDPRYRPGAFFLAGGDELIAGAKLQLPRAQLQRAVALPHRGGHTGVELLHPAVLHRLGMVLLLAEAHRPHHGHARLPGRLQPQMGVGPKVRRGRVHQQAAPRPGKALQLLRHFVHVA